MEKFTTLLTFHVFDIKALFSETGFNYIVQAYLE